MDSHGIYIYSSERAVEGVPPWETVLGDFFLKGLPHHATPEVEITSGKYVHTYIHTYIRSYKQFVQTIDKNYLYFRYCKIATGKSRSSKFVPTRVQIKRREIRLSDFNDWTPRRKKITQATHPKSKFPPGNVL